MRSAKQATSHNKIASISRDRRRRDRDRDRRGYVHDDHPSFQRYCDYRYALERFGHHCRNRCYIRHPMELALALELGLELELELGLELELEFQYRHQLEDHLEPSTSLV